MKKYLKRLLSGVFVLSLFFACLIPTYASAEKVTIDVSKPVNMDIVFSSRDTNRSSQFKQQLLQELATMGIDTSRINVQSVDSQTQDLKSSFSWNNDVSSSIGTISTSSNSVSMRGNSRNQGKICTWTMPSDEAKIRTISTGYNIDYGDSYNAAGIMFNVKDTGSYLQGYALSFNYSGYFTTSNGYGTIWRMNWPKYQYSTPNSASTMTKIGSINIAKSGTVTLAIQKDKVTVSGPGYSGGTVSQTFNLDKTYGGNGFGFFSDHHSHNCSSIGSFNLTNISMKTVNYKLFDEILQQPEWRNDAYHIAVNDSAEEEFASNPESYNDMLSRTLNNDIRYYSYVSSGNTSAKQQQEQFVTNNNGNGKVLTKNSSFSNDVKALAQDIKKYLQENNSGLIEETRDSETGVPQQYILLGETIELNTNPASYKDNPPDNVDFPYGRWRVEHDYNYFLNSEGQAANTGTPQKSLNCAFDKPGKYKIYFDDELIKIIYAHRAPVAAFSMTRSGNNITTTNQSYDLDDNTDIGFGKGIKEIKWQYQKYGDEGWTNDQLTTIDPTKSYVIQLTVTDNQGATSQATKYITSSTSTAVPPVADFSFASDIISKYSILDVIDNSYDPANKTLTSYHWTLTGPGGYRSENYGKNNYVKTFSSSSMPVGQYTLALAVTNSSGTVSKTFSRPFTVTPDKIAPNISTTTPSSEWKHSVAVNFNIADSDSGVYGYQYYINKTRNENTGLYGGFVTSASGTQNFGTGSYTNGQFFLHIRAKDKAGNIETQVYGPYRMDNTVPSLTVKVENLPVDEGTKDSSGTIVKGYKGWKYTVSASDPGGNDGSGIAGYAVTKYDTAPEANAFQKEAVFEKMRAGTNYFWTIDKAGNISKSAKTTTKSDLKYNGKLVNDVRYNNIDVDNLIYNHTMLRVAKADKNHTHKTETGR